ncbi:hypothetical protein GLOTRDRAFT_129456 [Gloeophyllum trabeum ATCC 11539]|uniref:F-box domain-containing protein n=1 Tax=Gloeophyllum trabeum (strain ATCC 11539 / FP-39264 / Madison 617) TaxID=670483 RepID=S7RQJ2_GLOTA|nr:uncharacterized protein GLOTRDRAFT_129456 [Gloeophyllum trabeum ATCC 11539]EPQ55164.1 hypothetical protein GLOTRDRAFT_129456 [Gloeophyllum trabeum ATCC 11539]
MDLDVDMDAEMQLEFVERRVKRLRETDEVATATTQSIQQRIGLLDVSKEILAAIIRLCDVETLQSLAVVCQRLHNEAFPYYMIVSGHVFECCQITHQNVQSPLQLSFYYDEEYRAIDVIKYSPMVLALGWIHTTFGPTDYWKMDQLAELTKGLLFVERVTWWMSFKDQPGATADLDTRAASSLIALLRGLVNKGCRRISLKPRDGEASVPRDLLYFKTDEPLYVLNALDRVQISLPVLGMSYFRHWAIESLNASPVRWLKICCNGLSSRVWRRFFCNLQLPYLDRLELDIDTLESGDLAEFLTRHPSLTWLVVHTYPLDPEKFTLPPDALTKLRRLHGEAIWISRFPLGDMGLPKLEELTIVSHNQRGAADMHWLASCMKTLATRKVDRPVQLSLYLKDFDQSFGATRVQEPARDVPINDQRFREAVSVGDAPAECVSALKIELYRDLAFGVSAHVLSFGVLAALVPEGAGAVSRVDMRWAVRGARKGQAA